MKARGFTVVLHDVQHGMITKEDVIQHLKNLSIEKAVVAQERYNHQDGSHIHIFYRLSNQAHFTAQLKYWVGWWTSGRVQVDIMRGEISQACRYLMEGYKKEKDYDSDPWFYPTKLIAVSPEQHADQWIHWFISMPIETWRDIVENHRRKMQCMVTDSILNPRRTAISSEI